MTDLALFPSTALVPTRTEVGSSATISAGVRYRYDLTRRWAIGDDWMLFVMLNPSTADGTQDDPTIRRCIAFAKREGFGGLAVVNLYAYRATDPKVLATARPENAEGPDNRETIARWVTRARLIVAAWGAHPGTGGQALHVTWACADAGKTLWCLGTTKHGHPRHPLYRPADTPLVEYHR
jgi:hypothetical protein